MFEEKEKENIGRCKVFSRNVFVCISLEALSLHQRTYCTVTFGEIIQFMHTYCNIVLASVSLGWFQPSRDPRRISATDNGWMYRHCNDASASAVNALESSHVCVFVSLLAVVVAGGGGGQSAHTLWIFSMH